MSARYILSPQLHITKRRICAHEQSTCFAAVLSGYGFAGLHFLFHAVQVCLLDLDYNLPVQVRDQALGMEDEALPESDVGREFALVRMANEGELGVGYNKSKANDTILKLQRTAPYYQVRTAVMCGRSAGSRIIV